MRDSQRSRVYAWERAQSWWQTASPGARYAEVSSSAVRPLTLPECEKLILRALRKAGCRMVDLGDGRGRRTAGGYSHRILLPTWARTKPVILHEAAHSVAAQRGFDDGHGPRFMRVYLDLLTRHLHLKPGVLLASARGAGVKVAPRNRTEVKP